jgi:CRP-like cAMP-binding protein
VLAEEGDLPTSFQVLLDGHVTVHRDGVHLDDLGAGDYFGEVGVLSLGARNASVIATTPVRVATAMGWDLRSLLDENPELRAKLTETAANRTKSD